MFDRSAAPLQGEERTLFTQDSMTVSLSLVLAALGSLSTLPSAALGGQEEVFQWDAAAAEHLLNRAAFGATPAEVADALALGREGLVDRLLAGSEGPGTPLTKPRRSVRPGILAPAYPAQDPMLAEGEVRLPWPEYLSEMGEYLEAWIGSMIRSEDPLRDRMALFWHNHFVSNFNEVGDAHKMVVQASFLRAFGLGNFEVLARGMARDPAMLEYLNNNINVKAHPNENWARELMELFTLGEGNYTEDDIKEAARAFTGWSDSDYAYIFNAVEHDFGMKEMLGISGNLDGDLVIDILLKEESCARFLTWKLLNYFEGTPPSEDRLADYSAYLRENDYNLTSFLRRLFLDDAFYRDELVGNRVSGPIDYLVGSTRRLGSDVPPQMLFAGADLLGQRLLYPPTVKGWEGGMTWLTTAAVLQRSNLIGAMLGLVDLAWLKLGGGEGMEGMERPRLDFKKLTQNDPMRILVWIQDAGWKPELDLTTGLTGSADADARVLADRLLARAADDTTIARIAAIIEEERIRADFPAELGYDTPQGSRVLLNVAHVILSLPEAMLN